MFDYIYKDSCCCKYLNNHTKWVLNLSNLNWQMLTVERASSPEFKKAILFKPWKLRNNYY